MKENSEPLHVVAGVIIRRRKILIARRLPGGAHGGLWEFPGGKVEEGESPADALRRELFEELGIAVRVHTPVLETLHAYPHRTIRLAAFWCRIAEGEPRPLECADVAWVSPSGMDRYLMPEADLPLINFLRSMEKGKARL
ncbi:(deoxy)nucleoside triphosphate pyrophosphohydrolase [bacterium]|nr:MAG: (deoxy)nucleoside triphosphate pyrophosphohydrolase [bacterium]